MKILFLDDSDMRHAFIQRVLAGAGHTVDHVETVDEACVAMAAGSYDMVFLDHDLADPNSTGEDVTRWMASSPKAKPVKQVIVHSANPLGAQKMVDCLRAAGFNTGSAPFGLADFNGIVQQLRANQSNPTGA